MPTEPRAGTNEARALAILRQCPHLQYSESKVAERAGMSWDAARRALDRLVTKNHATVTREKLAGDWWRWYQLAEEAAPNAN